MKMISAELVTIGDEILYGQITDTNSQWMSDALSNAGVRVVRKTSVGDDESKILTAFAEAEARADIVLITGGLGPTSDDLTKPCLARYFECELELNDEALADVTAFFKSRGRELTEINRQQAMLPSCCEKVTNANGTAPGMWFQRNGKVFVSMPGVPHEMKQIMTDSVIPRLRSTFQPNVIHHKVIRTVGLGESFLAEKIRDWEASLPSHVKLAYLPGLGEVNLRLTSTGDSLSRIQAEADNLVKGLHEPIGQFIYGFGDQPLPAVVGDLLRKRGLTLALAESCTGGYLSHLITSIPGSSDFFSGGVTAYANHVKTEQLGVSDDDLRDHGAVSEPVILAMARGIRQRLNTDIGVATSGIAGPGGGTPDKPVGTVWIAYSDRHQTLARKLQLSKDRVVNIKATCVHALNLIRQSLPVV